MTRTEAIKKIHGIAHPECLVQALEALGLIKFEEESNMVANIIGFTFMSLRSHTGSLTTIGKEFINDLERSGYKVVKA